jgi:imidazolonepropionase-like amidohydrolase
VTSARDLGAPLEASIAVRGAIRAGKIPGPTLYVSGPFIQHRPYPGTEAYRWGVNGPARTGEGEKAGGGRGRRHQAHRPGRDDHGGGPRRGGGGAPAQAAGRRALAPAEEIRHGLAVGVDCFEHTGLATAPEYPADVIAMLRERTARGAAGPLFWTPTIEGLFNYESVRDNPEHLDDPSWHLGLTAPIIDDIRRSIARPERLGYFQITPSRRPTLARKFQQLRESGVMLLVGTDSGIPMKFHSQSTWNELDVWVTRLGVDPMFAIRAATYWPAVAMKVDKDVGTLAEGKFADIIAVRGDVLRHISLLRRVDIVIKRGKRYR